MNAYEQENEIFLHIDRALYECCRYHWTAIDMEDRVAEARYVFLTVLRTSSIPEEEIWSVFKDVLEQHMKPIHVREAQHKHMFSLRTPLRRNNGEAGSTLLDLLPAPEQDHSVEYVEHFLAFLPEQEQLVCTQLLCDPCREEAARRLKIPLKEVNRIHHHIVQQYNAFTQVVRK